MASKQYSRAPAAFATAARTRFRCLAPLGIAAIALILALVASPVPAADAGDPSQSTAAAPAQKTELIATRNVYRIMREGGLLMWPIALCSLVMLAFTFERLIALRWRRVIPKPFVTRVLQQIRERALDRDQALALCEENGSTVASVFAGGIRKWGRPAVEVEQAILDAGERAIHVLRAYLRVFSATSTVSPLLGLLGTVFGMIEAFNAVAVSDAMGRPELLAHGVAGALLTTAFGLIVAIPAMLLYYLFVARVDRLVKAIDGLGEDLVWLISAEALERRGDEGRRRRVRRETASEEKENDEPARPETAGRPAQAQRPQGNKQQYGKAA